MTNFCTDLSLRTLQPLNDLEPKASPRDAHEGSVDPVPKDRCPLRMKLAWAACRRAAGSATRSSTSDALFNHDLRQNINHLRALEGELARTIPRHRPLQAARCSVLPERPLFPRETAGTVASIVVRVRVHSGTRAYQRVAIWSPPRQRPDTATGLDRR